MDTILVGGWLRRNKRNSETIKFRAGRSLPTGDAVHQKCMEIVGNDFICGIIKNLYCAVVPQACDEIPPTCAPAGGSCLTMPCCVGLNCDPNTQTCDLPQ